jgi:hypothetical protein
MNIYSNSLIINLNKYLFNDVIAQSHYYGGCCGCGCGGGGGGGIRGNC